MTKKKKQFTTDYMKDIAMLMLIIMIDWPKKFLSLHWPIDKTIYKIEFHLQYIVLSRVIVDIYRTITTLLGYTKLINPKTLPWTTSRIHWMSGHDSQVVTNIQRGKKIPSILWIRFYGIFLSHINVLVHLIT